LRSARCWPMPLPPIQAAAWQIGLGCFPIVIIGLAVETTHIEKVTQLGWWLLIYSTVIQFCIAYVSWFAALARLPASVAAIGTMAVPVIGVVASAIAIGEPLALIQIVALVFTVWCWRRGLEAGLSDCNGCRFAVGISARKFWHNECQAGGRPGLSVEERVWRATF
jgi:drug/metabolite transporter (DMT)-like permease